MAAISGEEVAKHNTRESCWIVLHGVVWDVTDEHPGGEAVILKYAGTDATSSYDDVHDEDLVARTLPTERLLGPVSSEVPAQKTKRSSVPNNPTKYPPLNTIISLADFEKIAQSCLTASGWAYYSSGAEDEYSILDAKQTFREISLRPRILRQVEPISTETTILGSPSSLPIYFSPTGIGRYAHRDAERIVSAVAGREGLIYCMPTSASCESVTNARSVADQSLFFQLYTGRDKDHTKTILREAKRLGVKAVFLTVDSPVLGKRERDDRIRAADGEDTIAGAGGVAKTTSRGLLNPLLSWDDIGWIREAAGLPLVLKGVQTVEDAVLAHLHGLDGIVLSNHGGRSQDTAQPPMVTLLEIRQYAPHLLSPSIRHKFQVFLDGGIRRGTDVIKAVALGATAVGIGRPALFSMCAGYGEKGLHRLVQILRAEVETNMALIGARNIKELVPEMVNSERAEVGVSRRVKL
ncbi:glycolate oxidase [Fusarium austroafricanum]|uniref:Glycolate oxidase n=1 Tax=Fusarium austroafricanum TaxID=2364996 RepID=A0A8H4JM07_9HYPO|nr:glycolate oxidase [Fusarium austroafricanum]